MCRILQKFGTFSVIFLKNWEICHFVYEILTNFNLFVEGKLQKIRIFHNRDSFRNISAILYVVS